MKPSHIDSGRRTSIAPVIKRIFASGQITRADEHSFYRAMSSEKPLSEKELHEVRRVFEWLQMGLLKVID